MEAKNGPRYTAQELEKRLQEDIRELAQATDAARMSGRMQRYLDMCARFHKYSIRNVWLIHMAMPKATRVAGFHKWKALGRYVRKGEKGIPILAPILVGKSGEEGDEDEKHDKELVGFKVVYVFDVSQTEGKPLEEAPAWKSGERNDQLHRRLLDYAASLGIKVREGKLPGEAQGVSKGGEIVLIPESGTKTLIHEIAHELMHQEREVNTSRKFEELEAESVSYVVGKHFGMSGLESPNYHVLHHISGKEVLQHMDRIQKISAQIISSVETLVEQEVEHVG